MKILNIFARLSIIPLIIALIFTSMHWPGALFLSITSSVLLIFFYGIKFLKTKEKSISDYLKITTVFSLATYTFINIVLGYKIPGLSYLYKILLLAYLISKFQYEGASIKQNTIATVLFGIGLIFLIIGFLFKLMHWPGGNASLILSSMVGIFWVIASLFNKNHNPSPEKQIEQIGKS